MTKGGKGLRKQFRFKPQEDEQLALIDKRSEISAKEFAPTVSGLLFSEAYGGCGLILRKEEWPKVGDHCLVKAGPQTPLKAEIVWRTDVDADVMKVGVKYLE